MPNIELSIKELTLLGNILFPYILELTARVQKAPDDDEETAKLLCELSELNRKLDYARLNAEKKGVSVCENFIN